MEALRQEIKQLIIKSLDLEDITTDDIEDDTPLFEAAGLGLDSIDALELGVALRKQYNLVLEANNASNRQYFHSVSTLASFVEQQRSSI